MAKNTPKIASVSIFGHFRTPYEHYRGIEEILSFELRGVMAKSVKNWLQKRGKCEATSILT